MDDGAGSNMMRVADTPDWSWLLQEARRMADRYVSACDADDISQDALLQLWRFWLHGRYDPRRSNPDTYLRSHLSHAIRTAVAIRKYAGCGLEDEECRDAFRRWGNNTSRDDKIKLLKKRYQAKGYCAATATAKATRIIMALESMPQVIPLDANMPEPGDDD